VHHQRRVLGLLARGAGLRGASAGGQDRVGPAVFVVFIRLAPQTGEKGREGARVLQVFGVEVLGHGVVGCLWLRIDGTGRRLGVRDCVIRVGSVGGRVWGPRVGATGGTVGEFAGFAGRVRGRRDRVRVG